MKLIQDIHYNVNELSLQIICPECNRHVKITEDCAVCPLCMREIEQANIAAWEEYYGPGCQVCGVSQRKHSIQGLRPLLTDWELESSSTFYASDLRETNLITLKHKKTKEIIGADNECLFALIKDLKKIAAAE